MAFAFPPLVGISQFSFSAKVPSSRIVKTAPPLVRGRGSGRGSAGGSEKVAVVRGEAECVASEVGGVEVRREDAQGLGMLQGRPGRDGVHVDEVCVLRDAVQRLSVG